MSDEKRTRRHRHRASAAISCRAWSTWLDSGAPLSAGGPNRPSPPRKLETPPLSQPPSQAQANTLSLSSLPTPPRVDLAITRPFYLEKYRITAPPVLYSSHSFANSAAQLLVDAPFNSLVERVQAEAAAQKGGREQQGHAGHHHGHQHQSLTIPIFEPTSQ